MPITRGYERGFIQSDNLLKVLSPEDGESPWVKVIAMHKNKKQGIGILQNTLFSKRLYWGQMVLFTEKSKDEIPYIVKKVDSVPNTKEWTTEF